MIQDQIQTIKTKLQTLKELDPQLEVFGASTHEYQLNPTLNESEIQTFEKQNGITLPADYRLFLQEIGNGGTGPYYGLWTMEEGIYEYEEYKEFTTDLSQPFPHTTNWNLEFEEVTEEEWDDHMKKMEEIYHIPKWGFGLLRLCHLGCSGYIGLVVNGEEYGHIWVDDRANHSGFFPDPYFDQKEEERTIFLDWYEKWLDKSIERMSWIAWLKKTILKELNSSKDGIELREYLVQFKEANGRMYDAYKVMKELHEYFEKQQKEQEENKIVELMGYVSGHCHKKYLVWTK